MFDILEKFKEDNPHLNMNEIMAVNIGFRNRTGERFVRVKTMDGSILIKEINYNGMISDETKVIRPYHNKEERNKLVRHLRGTGLNQEDIADYLEISQGTVSNILRG